MAKAPATAESEKVASVTDTIMYLPGPMDPPTTTWGGLVFKANVPREITGNPDGTNREKLNHELLVSARHNKFFQLGSGGSRKADTTLTPTTAKGYRAHVVNWLNACENVDELMTMWARDKDLRTACEVGTDDFDYLGSLIKPKLSELAKSEGLLEPRVGELWVQHGVNELPW